MKRFDLALVLIGSAAAMSPAFAASNAMPGMGTMDAGGMGGMSAAAGATQGFMAHGTINSVNRAAGTVNITHQAIKALGWPGMTMDFGVRNKSMLVGLKPGDAVNFDLAKGLSGQYVVARMAAAK
ncbi:conserved exported hypothetical protein [Thiomonas arsenitoxydans]|uniref:Cation efflux system protein cusF n=1 Tax=Thiomonas arsenitoxydans (strain DSM 22701 / CIP 110005 / 3As) TaxID=426114 RepID=D6CTQ3_THIA3|nr:copper-binding protein [Thiomonas arsenitoxydans]CQR44513.1 conserved exported hypothetical protein [Thiomonas sp. CB3]CAZ88672.1 conserved hypothetical protein; putative exported protein [Thiomonas arsenitoxydans]CQR27820.1 conserved exported hypothetical protein [Thiomonas arsenitoxydans]CQR31899.1 conserved exported hypothetical protein [Thiomonas arsenitoxydans]CQR34861.1 conserved exported hypothetical protein [Thiomonas arsenitoxydans]